MHSPAIAETGLASTYCCEATANGEYAFRNKLTAAHRTLPFGTFVKVMNRSNGRAVVVRINDRGPHVRGRVIDLTPAAAAAIGSDGLAPVDLSIETAGGCSELAGFDDAWRCRFILAHRFLQ